jgi:hypothetical protein
VHHARKEHEEAARRAGFFLGLLFKPEDGSYNVPLKHVKLMFTSTVINDRLLMWQT